MKNWIVILLTFIVGEFAWADETQPSPQVSATQTIHKLLVDGKYEEVHRDWCHPHLQEQIDAAGFAASMKEDFGKGVIKVFADVVKAIEEQAGPDSLVAQAQEDPDEYEFILPQVRRNNPFGAKGNPWHIELKLHEGRWKLMDVD